VLRTTYITGDSDYKVILKIISGKNGENYREYEIPETPVKTNITVKDGIITISTTGGYLGQLLTLTSSTDMKSWTNVTYHTVGYDSGSYSGLTFSESVSGPQKFYRVITGPIPVDR
jgi:hypothetical protein